MILNVKRWLLKYIWPQLEITRFSFHSFIAPRPNAKHQIEPTERAANRTAAQIDLALRQVKADRATYLRNTNKPVSMPPMSSSSDEAGSQECKDLVSQCTVNPVIIVMDNIRSAFNV